MSYIRSIAPQAQEFGIAKIVPPETWRMPFVTDTEVSVFVFLNVFVLGLRRGTCDWRESDELMGHSF
jgi:hypothetical protein